MPRIPHNEIAEAANLFEDFTGHKGEVIARLDDFPAVPKSVLAIGHLIDVGYVTVRDNEKIRYRHEFKPYAQPLLLSSHDGRQLYVYGGRYNFTERGIVDKKR